MCALSQNSNIANFSTDDACTLRSSCLAQRTSIDPAKCDEHIPRLCFRYQWFPRNGWTLETLLPNEARCGSVLTRFEVHAHRRPHDVLQVPGIAGHLASGVGFWLTTGREALPTHFSMLQLMVRAAHMMLIQLEHLELICSPRNTILSSATSAQYSRTDEATQHVSSGRCRWWRWRLWWGRAVRPPMGSLRC